MPTPRKPGSMYGWPWRQKLAAIVDRRDADECWPLIDRNRDADGYAHLVSADTGETLVHRLAVIADGRHIPDGWEVDHLCRRRDCANPAHLEVVPKLVNLARSQRGPQPTCRRGHDLTQPGARYPYRGCRACKREDYLRSRGRTA